LLTVENENQGLARSRRAHEADDLTEGSFRDDAGRCVLAAVLPLATA
jgi:hypothetical protein